ncbi:MAG: acyl carrier protein [Planctomycetota bacterium]|jgi:acyl carrier protein
MMETSETEKLGRSEIIEQMRQILEPWVSDVDALDDIEERTNLVADLGLDSIGILQVILGLEKEFGISIRNNELDAETFSMMGNLVGIIEGKLHENNRPA